MQNKLNAIEMSFDDVAAQEPFMILLFQWLTQIEEKLPQSGDKHVWKQKKNTTTCDSAFALLTVTKKIMQRYESHARLIDLFANARCERKVILSLHHFKKPGYYLDQSDALTYLHTESPLCRAHDEDGDLYSIFGSFVLAALNFFDVDFCQKIDVLGPKYGRGYWRKKEIEIMVRRNFNQRCQANFLYTHLKCFDLDILQIGIIRCPLTHHLKLVTNHQCIYALARKTIFYVFVADYQNIGILAKRLLKYVARGFALHNVKMPQQLIMRLVADRSIKESVGIEHLFDFDTTFTRYPVREFVALVCQKFNVEFDDDRNDQIGIQNTKRKRCALQNGAKYQDSDEPTKKVAKIAN